MNLFNQFQLCGCGGTTFGTAARNGGGVDIRASTTTVQTPVTTPARFQPFNPFTTTPVRGRELGLRSELRQGAQPLRLHDAASLRLSFGVRF